MLQKCTLLVKDFKYGSSSFSLFVWKNDEAQGSQISLFFIDIIIITQQLS